MAWLQNGIDKSRDGYVRLVTPIARRGFIALLLVGGFVLATGGIGSLVPSGFLPDEDQGAFMAEVQLPDASSTNRTLKSIEEVEQTIAGRPWMQSMFTVSGYSLLDGLNLPNRGLVVVELKPFAERKDRTLTVFHALKEVNAAFAQIASANVFAFNLPPIMGLGNSSGFEFVVQSLAGAPPVDLAAVARGMMVSAQEVPELANVFTTYAASTPQINLKLDRERAQALGVTHLRHLLGDADRRWAAPTPTTSTCSAGSGRSRCRPTRPTAATSTTCSACACARRTASWCPCRRWPISS